MDISPIPSMVPACPGAPVRPRARSVIRDNENPPERKQLFEVSTFS